MAPFNSVQGQANEGLTKWISDRVTEPPPSESRMAMVHVEFGSPFRHRLSNSDGARVPSRSGGSNAARFGPSNHSVVFTRPQRRNGARRLAKGPIDRDWQGRHDGALRGDDLVG